MKQNIWFIFLLMVIISSTGCSKLIDEKVIAKDKGASVNSNERSVFVDLPQVAHGLGYIDGHYVTNTIEALLHNYERGFRVFEVDLNMTSDNRLIARHDWTAGHYGWLGQDYQPAEDETPIPFDTVMSLKIHGKYDTASWEQLLKVMQKYPDIYLVTDTKQKDEESVRKTFSYIVNSTKQIDAKLLNRIIPQIYDQDMLSYIESYHNFNDVIYTLYQHTNDDIPSPNEIADWSDRNNITAIAGLPFRLNEELRTALREKNIAIYTHTINAPEEAAAFKESGIGIYTDYLIYDGQDFIAP